jgi:2-keto-4-pentenoate hydratase
VPDGVDAGMRALLARREDELAGGALSVGWKIGINASALQAHFGLSGPVVGYLTDATVHEPGVPIDIASWTHPALEVEVAIRIGSDGAVAALAPALELVDLNLGFDEIEPILAGNVFHRGVIFGPELVEPEVRDLQVEVRRAGERVASGQLTEQPAVTVGVVRSFLDAHGATLMPGERIIAGSLIAPMAVAPGDDITVSFGSLGLLGVNFR